MVTVNPSPQTWTLRFKHRRTTALLEVDPLQKFADIRAELLHALHETHPTGKLNDQDIPKNPDHIQLGRAVDRNKLSLGFVSIDSQLDEPVASSKGKGKSAAGSGQATAAANGVADCPQGRDFRNGDVLAFKFAGEDEEMADEGEHAGADTKWDVHIPTLEDTYGDEAAPNEGIGVDEG